MHTENREAVDVTAAERPGNHCFGCGPDNPEGLHLRFSIDDSHPEHLSSTATIELGSTREGAPGFIHGGIIATMLDEAMSKLNRPLQVVAMTRHMEVDYLRPVRVGATVTIIGRHVRRDGKKLFHSAEIVDAEGRILTKAKAVFVLVEPALGFRPAR